MFMILILEMKYMYYLKTVDGDPAKIIQLHKERFMNNYNKISKTEPSFYEFICSSYDNCWIQCGAFGCIPSYTYIKGLGGPYYECHDYFYGFIDQENKLVYYRKGDETSGTPLIVSDIFNNTMEIEIRVFPNPTNDLIWINIPNSKLPITFELIDIKGQTLMKRNITNIVTTIDIKSYSEGIYLYRISNNDGVIICD